MIKYLIGDKDFLIFKKEPPRQNTLKLLERKCGIGADALISPRISPTYDFSIAALSQKPLDFYSSLFAAACYARYIREELGVPLFDFEIEVNGNLFSLALQAENKNIFTYFPPKCKYICSKTINFAGVNHRYRIVEFEKPIAVFKCESIDTVDIRRVFYSLWQNDNRIESAVFFDAKNKRRFISCAFPKQELNSSLGAAIALACIFSSKEPLSFDSLPFVALAPCADGAIRIDLSPQKVYELNGIFSVLDGSLIPPTALG